MAFRDWTGHRFSRLVPYRYLKGFWWCRCDCGGHAIARAGDLNAGNVKSCGCMRREHCRRGPNKHHGEGAKGKTTPEYEVWKGMKARCGNPQHIGYANYGGRGIRVCERWSASYEDFLADMGRRPSPDYSIDRINNDGDYTPANCRWATRTEQARHRDFSALGIRGGHARAAALTAEQRTAISRHAIQTRLRKRRAS